MLLTLVLEDYNGIRFGGEEEVEKCFNLKKIQNKNSEILFDKIWKKTNSIFKCVALNLF